MSDDTALLSPATPSPGDGERELSAITDTSQPALVTELEAAVRNVNPLVLLVGSWAGYAVIVLGASSLVNGGPPAVIRQLLELTPWMLPVSLVCLAPLAAGLLFAQTQTHRFAAFAKIKAMMTTGMLPILRRMSWWSRGLLAMSFGFGEELLFRGLLQPSIKRMSLHKLGETSAQALAVSVSSVVFGALHAVTPLNFFWATAVGAVLGLEYMSAGLLAAAVTHWLYDWLAFELQFWLPICSEQHAAQRTVGTH